MQVNAVIKQHRDFGKYRFYHLKIHAPVISGKIAGDNAQFVGLVGIVLFSAAGKSDEHQKRKQQRSYFS